MSRLIVTLRILPNWLLKWRETWKTSKHNYKTTQNRTPLNCVKNLRIWLEVLKLELTRTRRISKTCLLNSRIPSHSPSRDKRTSSTHSREQLEKITNILKEILMIRLMATLTPFRSNMKETLAICIEKSVCWEVNLNNFMIRTVMLISTMKSVNSLLSSTTMKRKSPLPISNNLSSSKILRDSIRITKSD